MSTLQQEMARLMRTRMDHIEQHQCRGLCDQAAYMQQLINDGHRWQEEGLAAKVTEPSGDLADIAVKVRNALALDPDAQHDPIRFALLVYETLSPGEILKVEQLEAWDRNAAINWTQTVAAAGGAQFVLLP